MADYESNILSIDIYIPHEDHTIGTLICAMVEELAWRAPEKLRVVLQEGGTSSCGNVVTIEACGYKMMSRVIVYPFPAGIVLNLVLSGAPQEKELTDDDKRYLLRHLAGLLVDYSNLNSRENSLGDLHAKLMMS